MAACSKYVKRLRQALKFRKTRFPEEVITLMGKRAKTDRQLDAIIHGVLDVIEPPYCQKSHCSSHTAFAFCGCSLERVPGKCPLNLTYLKNRREREEADFQKRLIIVPEKYLPLSPENEKKIREMHQSEWIRETEKWKIKTP